MIEERGFSDSEDDSGEGSSTGRNSRFGEGRGRALSR
jgi:hypothetical protein